MKEWGARECGSESQTMERERCMMAMLSCGSHLEVKAMLGTPLTAIWDVDVL